MQISTAINIPKPNMIAGQVGPAAYGPGFITDFTSGNQSLDPRITFSRASNATVTDSSGNIVYAPHNLVTFSEQFDNSAWTKSNATVAANTTLAPDGTTTADKLVEDTAAAQHNLYTAIFTGAGVPQSYSVYAKAGERKFLTLGDNTSGSTSVYDLELGTVISSGTDRTASITPIGNGWYRCSNTGSLSGSQRVYIGMRATAGNGTYTGNGTSGLFIWGAQLNVGSLQSYNPTTVKNLLGFSEQFDNAAWTKSNSFIQTNLLTFSEQFDNAIWVKSNVTTTANVETSPNSSTTADKLIANTTNTSHYSYELASVTSGIVYTFSVYAKKAEYSRLSIGRGTAAGGLPTGGSGWYIDLNTGTVVGTPAWTVTVTPATNGFYRITGTFTATATSAGDGPAIYLQDNTGTNFAGNGTDGIFIWGAQLVQGSVAGDYQQTTSSALAVMYQDPNGTMTADKLVEDTATTTHQVFQSGNLSANVFNMSLYAKAGERRRVFFRMDDGGSTNVRGYTFDLISGTITSGTSGTTGTLTTSNAFINNIGNGWYQIGFTGSFSAASTARGRIFIANDAGGTSYAGDGTSGIYIWGAQLSDSASLDQYVNNPVAAPSSTAFYGARFDYDPVTLQPRGLLIEEQRSNLLLRSEEFDNASWTKARATVTANTTTSPDGTVDADKLVEDTTASNTHLVEQTASTTSGTTYTFSVYVKAAERTFVTLQYFIGTSYSNTFNLSTGVVTGGNGTGTITAVGNGWYRVTSTAAATATGTGFFDIFLNNGTSITYTGDGTSGLFIWGAQLEAGAFPTSYIPTTTAQVTRSADVALIQGSNFSSWFNVNESSLFVSPLITTARTSDSTFIRFDDGTGNNRFQIGSGSSFTIFNSFVIAGGASQGNNIVSTSPFGANKAAFGLALNSSVTAVNGTTGTTDTTVTMPTGINRMLLGRDDTTGYINGYIRQIAYYPRRLQNSELQAITS